MLKFTKKIKTPAVVKLSRHYYYAAGVLIDSSFHQLSPLNYKSVITELFCYRYIIWKRRYFGANKLFARQIHDRICLTDVVWLTYTNRKGELRTGMAALEFEFMSSSSSIKYLDVSYSDPELMDVVESNRKILLNIDSYLRNKIMNVEYNF